MRTQPRVAIGGMTPSPLLLENGVDGVPVPSPAAVHALPPATSTNGGALSTTASDVVSALRYVAALIKQLPLQPLVAALVVSLMLGALPMLLTALYSTVCALAQWCRKGFNSHTFSRLLVGSHQEFQRRAASPVGEPSMIPTPLHELLDQSELL